MHRGLWEHRDEGSNWVGLGRLPEGGVPKLGSRRNELEFTRQSFQSQRKQGPWKSEGPGEWSIRGNRG